jgi:hypothetical protein
MKKVFAAYIGEVGALGPESDQMARAQYDPLQPSRWRFYRDPESDQMARAQYDPTTHRYRLLVNPAVLKPEYTYGIDNPNVIGANPGFAESVMALAYRASCETLVKETINQDPSLEKKLVPTLALCNVQYSIQMAGNGNQVDIFEGAVTQGGKNLALKLWKDGNYWLVAQRVMYMYWEKVNQKLVDWKTATAPTTAR